MKKYIIGCLTALLLLGGCAGEAGSTKESSMAGKWISISQEEARERMKQEDGHLIVDVRRQDEYEAGHIPGAILVTNEDIGSEKPEKLPDLNQILLIYCRSGRRSKEAAEKLARLGYTRIYEFGGILDWTGETQAGPEPGGKDQTTAVPSSEPSSPLQGQTSLEGGASCRAQLSFPSFDGGGPSYEFVNSDPDIVSFETQKVYGNPDHDKMDGSPYDVILTLRALKEGSSYLTVKARSPIEDSYDAEYYITVDGALQIRISEPVIHEVIDGTRATDEVLRPRPMLVIDCGGRLFYAAPEENPSAEAFLQKLSEEGPLTVSMHDYGSFEKVGPLPWTLPRSDESITTRPGDVILYQGNQITVYYDTNSWSLTRLARIEGAGREELLEAFGKSDVSMTFRVEWGE